MVDKLSMVMEEKTRLALPLAKLLLHRLLFVEDELTAIPEIIYRQKVVLANNASRWVNDEQVLR